MWPFRDRKESKALSLEAEAAINWAGTRREFRPIMTAKEAESFFFSSARIIEFASEAESQDPEFRDHFRFFAHKLREEKPPGVLRLLDFGEERGRLFRVWERRELFSACTCSLGDSTRTRERLVSLIDGLLYLEVLFPVQVLHVSAFSLDRKGFFVARLPFTTKVAPEALVPGDLWHRDMTFLDLNAAMPYEPTRAESFLSSLGNFVCHQLKGQWLYSQAPISKIRTGVMPERSALSLEPELLFVLYRMAPESQADRYPVIEALRDLRSCLRNCS